MPLNDNELHETIGRIEERTKDIAKIWECVSEQGKKIAKIEESTKDLPQIKENTSRLDRKVARLEVKSSLWGALGGIIAILGFFLISWLKKW